MDELARWYTAYAVLIQVLPGLFCCKPGHFLEAIVLARVDPVLQRSDRSKSYEVQLVTAALMRIVIGRETEFLLLMRPFQESATHCTSAVRRMR